MSAHALIAFSHAMAGREEEYERWYDDQHLGDVLAVDGIVAARRYAATLDDRAAPPPPDVRLAIYDMDVDDPAALRSHLDEIRGTDRMPISEAMAQPPKAWIFEELTARGAGRSEMATHVMVAFEDRADDRERSPGDLHPAGIEDALAVEGCTGARWYRLSPRVPRSTEPPGPYLVSYEFETTEPARTRAAIVDVVLAAPAPPGAGRPNRLSRAWVYEAIGPRLSAAG